MSARLLLGDCIEVMATLPDASIDAIVCDPPYGLGFMGKAWDVGVPGLEWAQECLRVLKPGGHLIAFGGTRTIHRLTCAVEDAGFEIRDTIHWLYWCVDEQTECLTRRGWMRHDELRDDDEVAAVDQNDGAIRWERPTVVNRQRYHGDMIRIRGKFTDQLVTPNHRIIGRFKFRRKAPEQGAMTAGELLDRPSVEAYLPTAGTLRGMGGPGERLAYLAGWWLTDAWPHRDGKACMFSQCKPATLAKLRAALDAERTHNIVSEYERPAKLPQHNPEHVFYLSGPTADFLRNKWPERRLEWDVLGWSEDERRALLAGLLDGDGSRRDGGWVFWSRDAARRSVVMALASTLGYRVNENADKGAVHGSERSEVRVRGIHRSAEAYAGVVWCPSVRIGAWLARRGRFVFVTGNSGFPKSLDVSKAIDAAAGATRLPVYDQDGNVVALPSSRPNSKVRNGGGFDGLRTSTESAGIQWATTPATPEAAAWEGWGTALKPATEPAVLARKPLGEGTVAANVLAHGTGGLHIDACRYAYGDPAWPGPADHPDGKPGQGNGRQSGASWTIPGYVSGKHALGRWPANVYACPKASRSEREAGCEHLPAMAGHEAVERKEGSAGVSNLRAGAGRTAGAVRNAHPT